MTNHYFHCTDCGQHIEDAGLKGTRVAYPCRTCGDVTTFERAD